MGKKIEVKYPNSVSETKISDQKVIREKILSIVNNNKSNNKSQYLSFFIVKLFEKNKFKSLSKDEILQTINEKYSKNPKYFKTSTDEHFKTKQSLITTLFRILNKISSYTKKNNLYKFNEKNTLKYFKKYLNTEENNIKTPVKIYNRKNNKIKKESASEDEEIKIKEENINIKEEDANDNNDVNDNKIKEEKSENDFVDMSIEIEEEKNDQNLFELFNKKLYDDFYLYLAEEGQFEQLQEKIEQFMDKYNNNELEENNKFSKELIHFFNIDKINASIYICLEIEGKKILQEKNKGKNYKLALNEIQNEKKEIICLIYENIELKIVIRIINKKEKLKSDEMDIKEDNDMKKRSRIYTQYNGINNNFYKKGLSIQERIKIFSGEFVKKKIYKNENIPGKLKIPEVFLQNNNKNDSSDKKNKEQKKESDK